MHSTSEPSDKTECTITLDKWQYIQDSSRPNFIMIEVAVATQYSLENI